AVDPTTLDAVLLSHAHIDHSGYLPRLARDGFRKPIYCSSSTADLLRIMLPDAAHLNEEEAEHRNRTGATTHRPALPLFPAEADTRLVESTYGNRLHEKDDATRVLIDAVTRAAKLRGWLLMPAFAIGRVQEVLYRLRELEAAGRIPELPIYLDSPMAIQATA